MITEMKKGVVRLGIASIVFLVMICLIMPAYAGNSSKNKKAIVIKKRPPASIQVSKPSNIRKGVAGASLQRRKDLKQAGDQLTQAKQNMRQAQRNLAMAKQAAGGLTKERINAMPNGPAKNQAFAATRQVKSAETGLRKAQGSLQNAQKRFKNASHDYMVSFNKNAIRRPVNKQPQGIRPIQPRAGQQPSQNQAESNAFRPPLPRHIANVSPPAATSTNQQNVPRLSDQQRAQLAQDRARNIQQIPQAPAPNQQNVQRLTAQQRAQQAQIRSRNFQKLPQRRIYDRVPPIEPNTSVIYAKLPALQPQRKEQLNARDAQGRPIGLYNPLKRRLFESVAQQQLIQPRN